MDDTRAETLRQSEARHRRAKPAPPKKDTALRAHARSSPGSWLPEQLKEIDQFDLRLAENPPERGSLHGLVRGSG